MIETWNVFREKWISLWKTFFFWCYLPSLACLCFVELCSRKSVLGLLLFLIREPLVFLYNGLIIAATASDEVNILCCLIANRMGVENTIARVRNPDYATQTQFMRNELGLSMIVNPEFETANEISRIIRFPSAANLDSFSRGKIEIASIRIHSDNMFCDMPLYEIRKKCKAKVLVCAVQRDDEVFIPSGDFVIRCDDIISITGTRSELSTFMKQTGVFKQKIKKVMIIGGGRIGYYLAKLLSDTGRTIKLIEQNDSRCYSLTDTLPDVTVIHGDGTDQDILEEQGLEYQDALVALTGIDEENIIVSMYAESKGINEYIVLAVTMLANFVLEYLFCKFVVYRGQEYTREEKPKKE